MRSYLLRQVLKRLGSCSLQIIILSLIFHFCFKSNLTFLSVILKMKGKLTALALLQLLKEILKQGAQLFPVYLLR